MVMVLDRRLPFFQTPETLKPLLGPIAASWGLGVGGAFFTELLSTL